jgi:hypothetical protein
MDSPLQAFPSEHRDSASEARQPGPTAPAPSSRRIIGYSRTFSGWTVAWHEAPPPTPREAQGALVVTGIVTVVVAAAALVVWLRPPVPSARVAAATAESASRPPLDRAMARAEAATLVSARPIPQTARPDAATSVSARPTPQTTQASRTTPAERPAPKSVSAPPAAAVRATPGRSVKAEPAPSKAPAAPPPAPPRGPGAREAARPQPGAAAAAARPTSAADQNGEGGPFVVITEPDGARVTINGVGYGTTPLTIRYLPPGAKRVRVTKTGYETEERLISADELAGRTPLRIDLSKADGRTPP